MNPILVAHGTRKPHGVAMIGRLASEVGELLGRPVDVAFVDVLGPTPSDVLRGMGRGPAVLVPAFLCSGYHVRHDIPTHVAESGHPDAVVTPALGPSAALAHIVVDLLVRSGWASGDSVVLAAAGTSDRGAQRDLRMMAAMVSAAIGQRAELAFAATGEPSVADAVTRLREGGASRVAVASYLLADGLFQDRLRASGADVVGEPLGTHPGVARLIASRFRRALVPLAA